MDTVQQLEGAAAESKAWLFEFAFPLWATAGFDNRAGLFREKLDASGSALPGPLRVRVQARQTYAFAEAGRLGWVGPWRERVEAGLRTLTSRATASGGAVGHLLNDGGDLVDARRDLYDQAFALFGLAHARSVDPAAADKRIRQILSYLDTQRLPPGGFLEGEIAPRPRRQNPHMHLFEAGIALAEAGFAQGEHLAEEMVELFRYHFFDGPSSSLGEFYDDHLRSAHGEPGQVTEPGHHFEWIWLLDRWARLTGKAHHNESLALWGHATRNGIMGPVAIDETWRSGGVKAPTARLWPQTERLKAGLVLWEATGEPNFAADAVVAYRGLRIFLDGVRPGLWWDRLTEDLTPLEEPSPASSFYHITLALAELNRVCVSA